MISVKEARAILGDNYADKSDEQVRQIIDFMYLLAKLEIEYETSKKQEDDCEKSQRNPR